MNSEEHENLRKLIANETKEQESLSTWLERQISNNGENGEEVMSEVLPDAVRSVHSFTDYMLPVLIQGKHGDVQSLLSSYFTFDWVYALLTGSESLLLLPVNRLSTSQNGLSRNEIDQIVLGLHAMLESESMVSVHLAVVEPLNPFIDLIKGLQQLRITMMTGMMLKPESRVFHARDYELESWFSRLYQLLPSKHVHLPKPLQLQPDEEMERTLMQFFAHNGSLAETAKALHLHRNTLVYRLDRFKQDTGRDVRLLDDALFVKLAILIGKITKNT